MKPGKPWPWAGLTSVALTVVGAASAQEKLPAPKPVPAAPPAINAAVPSTAVPLDSTPLVLPEAPPPVGGLDEEQPLGFYGSAEYLLLRPLRRGIDIAVNTPINNNHPEGAVTSLDWDFKSGFRVGGGVRLPGEGWDVGVFYTNFYTNINGGVAAFPGGVLFATQTQPGCGVEQVLFAQANNTLNYNVWDIEVGRQIEVGHSLDLRLVGGARMANINQSFGVLYDGGDANMDLVVNRAQFTGGGFRVGGQGNWNIGSGFSLYGKSFASLLTGTTRSSVHDTNDAGATLVANVSDKFKSIVPVLEVGLGVAWQYHGFRLSAGYEFVNWFGLYDVPTFVDDFQQGKLVRNTADLGLEGLAVKAQFTY
jgi:hypothetical protein